MVFQYCHQRAADGEAGAVEGVQQLVFSVFVFKARFHAAGLEIFAVRAAGDFAVGVLRGYPYFQIVGFGGTKTHVASTQHNHAVRQFQQLQDFLGMADHFFQRVVRFFRVADLHHFHFIKLVLAD